MNINPAIYSEDRRFEINPVRKGINKPHILDFSGPG